MRWTQRKAIRHDDFTNDSANHRRAGGKQDNDALKSEKSKQPN